MKLTVSKIAFRDDYNDAIMAAAIVLGQDPNNPSDLDAIKDLLIQQKKLNKTYWQTGDEFSKLFANKQVSVGLMWSGQSATMKQDGQPIGFVVPEDGAIGWVDNWAIAKSSENKELAYAFINYMIGKDVQYGWASKGGPSPANREAADAIDPSTRLPARWMKHPSIVSSSWNTEHLKSKGMERCLDGSKGF